jgi:hypothetical protein
LPEIPLAQQLKVESDAEKLPDRSEKTESISGFRDRANYVACSFCGCRCTPFERSLGSGRFYKEHFEKNLAKKMASKNRSRGPPQ